MYLPGKPMVKNKETGLVTQENSGRVPIIYILSNGRSGSTLLDVLLGAHPNMWTLGEAQLLPWMVRENVDPCGCGQPVFECKFWRSILPEIPFGSSGNPIENFRETPGGGRVLRWNHLLDLHRGRISSRKQKAAAGYGQLNAQYFNLVREAAQAYCGNPVRWLVDSSKDPYRLLWLQCSGLFEIRVIHLVKDPRAFVYSMAKKGSPSVAPNMAVRMTGRWLVENLLDLRLCRTAFPPAQTTIVRYEELASQPQQTLARLADWLGLGNPDAMIEGWPTSTNHGISGNTMRWKKAEIQLDTRWKTDLPPAYANFARILTWPLARALGY